MSSNLVPGRFILNDKIFWSRTATGVFDELHLEPESGEKVRDNMT